jgi:DNA (cytosine-5)-methyltransferase 1
VNLVTHTITGEGFDASEDGTGRGTPLVAHALTACKTASGRMDPSSDTIIPIDMRQASRGGTMTNNRTEGGAPGTGIGEDGDPCPTLADSHTPAIAFTIHGTDTNGKVASPDEVAQCIRTRAPGSTENSSTTVVAYQCQGSNVGPMGTIRAGNGNECGGVPFVAFAQNQRDELREMDIAGALSAEPGMKQQTYISQMGVRKLMPIECERLQGFPDDWTRYGADDEEMADSVRYRMCGNAVAVPCIEWIGRRLMDAQ